MSSENLSPHGRVLTRPQRAAAYAALGVAGEVAFTAARDLGAARRNGWRLQGHSYLWMLPIYGSIAVGYEPLRDRLRSRAPWQRASVYALGIFAAEYAFGRAIAGLTGAVPWDYTEHSRFAVNGAIRLDYAPVWAVAGLLLEPITDAARAVSVPTRPRSSV